MNTSEWLTLVGIFITIATAVGGTTWRLLARMDSKEKDLRTDIGSIEVRFGASLAKYDFDLGQFKEQMEKEFLRTREFELAQKNTDRRLESIEAKVDRIPDSLDRQSERLIAALKETRPRAPSK